MMLIEVATKEPNDRAFAGPGKVVLYKNELLHNVANCYRIRGDYTNY
jgi:hypothetical protein